MNAIIVKALKLYYQMSSPALRVKWDDIVEDIYFTKGWFNDQGGNVPYCAGILETCMYNVSVPIC